MCFEATGISLPHCPQHVHYVRIQNLCLWIWIRLGAQQLSQHLLEVHLYWWPRSLSAVGGSPFLSRSRWSVSAPFCCLFDAFSLGILPSKLEDKSTITCDYTKQDKSQSLSQTWPPQCEHIYLGPPELEARAHAEPGRGSNPTIICVSITVIHAVP